ncbi:MAG: ATP-binding protein [Thermoleophilia bacterium]|nr:ATP-binding protein [Thermoleophilia bacterium]
MHDLSLYLLEMIENSVRAGATRVDIALRADRASDELRMVVADNGPGLDVPPEKALDPFYTTKPGKKTGLGLSLLQADAQAAGGELDIGRSAELGGTKVEVLMKLSHVDRPPLGDMAATLLVAAVTNPQVEFRVTLEGDLFDTPVFRASPKEAAEVLGRSLPSVVPID